MSKPSQQTKGIGKTPRIVSPSGDSIEFLNRGENTFVRVFNAIEEKTDVLIFETNDIIGLGSEIMDW